MRRTYLVVLFALLGCSRDEKSSDKKDKDEVIEDFDGTASIDGKKTKITKCEAVDVNGHSAVRFTLGTGMVVTADPVEGSKADGKKLDCSKVAGRSSGGVFGKKVWAKGKLELVCDHPDGKLVVEVKYDCGSKDRPSNLKDD